MTTTEVLAQNMTERELTANVIDAARKLGLHTARVVICHNDTGIHATANSGTVLRESDLRSRNTLLALDCPHGQSWLRSFATREPQGCCPLRSPLRVRDLYWSSASRLRGRSPLQNSKLLQPGTLAGGAPQSECASWTSAQRPFTSSWNL